jgi:hypothetical protein
VCPDASDPKVLLDFNDAMPNFDVNSTPSAIAGLNLKPDDLLSVQVKTSGSEQ